MFESTLNDGVLQLYRPETRWLSTGWNGGTSHSAAAYNITVPTGWEETDIDDYVSDRLQTAGFAEPGPALLTGVEMGDVRGARLGPAVAYATAGVSNPAALPVSNESENCQQTVPNEHTGDETDISEQENSVHYGQGQGTVNLIVGVDRQLSAAGRANMLTVVAEAKAATLLSLVGVPGTTTDAVIVGDNPDGEAVQFTGSATPVGDSVRACVREAVSASLASRYEDDPMPQSVDEATYGVTTSRQAEVFDP